MCIEVMLHALLAHLVGLTCLKASYCFRADLELSTLYIKQAIEDIYQKN